MSQWHFLVIIFLNLVIGVYVYTRGAQKQTHIAFAVLNLAITFWIGSLFWLSNIQAADGVLLLSRIAFAAGMFVPCALMHFIHCYPNKKALRKTLALIYAPGLAIALLAFTPLIVHGVTIFPWGVKVTPGKAYLLVLVYFISYLGLVFETSVRSYIQAKGMEKTQWLFIMLGLPIPVIHAMVTNLILPRLGFDGIYKLGPFASTEMILILGYAIVRYKLFDIEGVLRKVKKFLVAVALMGVLYLLFILLPQAWLGGAMDYTPLSIAFLALALLTALAIDPLSRLVDKIMDRYILKKQRRNHRLLSELAAQLHDQTQAEKAVQFISRAVVELKLKGIAVYLRDENRSFVSAIKTGEADDCPASFALDPGTSAFLQASPGLIDAGEYRHTHAGQFSKQDPICRFLDEMKSEIIAPLNGNGEFFGIIFFKGKKDGKFFRQAEYRFMRTLADEIKLVLANIKTYERLFNKEKAALLGTISASLVHEVNNPLASIRSFIDMIPANIEKKEFVKKFMEIVPADVKRIMKVTENLMNYATPTDLSLAPTRLKTTLEQALFLLETQLAQAQIQVEQELGSIPEFQADERKILQVLVNLILNAIQASRVGGKIKVTAKVGRAQSLAEPPLVEISVQDEGEGIAPEHFKEIFEPFYSTKIYGTGLGLATCKRIIEAHHGRISVESKAGAGAKFNFTLPLKASA